MKAPRKPRLTKQNSRPFGPDLGERIASYFSLHKASFQAAIARLIQAPYSSGITVVVIAIALALPASFQLVIKNMRQMTAQLEIGNQVSVYLKPETSPDTARRLADKLLASPQISSVQVISKEQGLEQLRAHSGFGDALKILEFNPLPIVIKILPRNSLQHPEEIDNLVAQLRGLQETDLVQSDQALTQRLNAWLRVADRSVHTMGVLLGLAVLLVVGNTIRLELYSRLDEIALQRLLGATDRFIRRPFLYAGLWYGLLGSLGAIFLVMILLLVVYGSVQQLNALYGGHLRMAFLGLGDVMTLMVVACLLGVTAAWTVLSYHLHQLHPE